MYTSAKFSLVCQNFYTYTPQQRNNRKIDLYNKLQALTKKAVIYECDDIQNHNVLAMNKSIDVGKFSLHYLSSLYTDEVREERLIMCNHFKVM